MKLKQKTRPRHCTVCLRWVGPNPITVTVVNRNVRRCAFVCDTACLEHGRLTRQIDVSLSSEERAIINQKSGIRAESFPNVGYRDALEKLETMQ